MTVEQGALAEAIKQAEQTIHSIYPEAVVEDDFLLSDQKLRLLIEKQCEKPEPVILPMMSNNLHLMAKSATLFKK